MVFKCKICGGDLEINNSNRITTCEYCGTKQTLPSSESDKVLNLYDRANHFRRNNEFDKAEAIYEMILNENTIDSEAYWSLVLCEYGVEYVKDPKTHEYIPTCNRTKNTSILADENYKQALEYANDEQKKLYKEEAEKINNIQKRILQISSKEEPFDVFICYKETDENGRRTQDSVMAQELYNKLKKEGYKVFFARITLEDKIGESYEPYIYAALNSAKVMLVVGTNKENIEAPWVKNEWSRFLALIKNGEEKTLIPCYKDMDPYDLPEDFANLQAQDMDKIGAEQDILHGVEKLINLKGNSKNFDIPLIVILVIILIVLVGGYAFYKTRSANSSTSKNTVTTTQDAKESLLKQDINARAGYVFNTKVDDVKEKVLKIVEGSQYDNTSEGYSVKAQTREGFETQFLGIGWLEKNGDDSYEESEDGQHIVGIEIYYNSDGYVESIECSPTIYGSGDPTGLVVPENLYNEAKKALGSETDEWKKLVESGTIQETTYNKYEQYKEVTDGSFYAGMEKVLSINYEN